MSRASATPLDVASVSGATPAIAQQWKPIQRQALDFSTPFRYVSADAEQWMDVMAHMDGPGPRDNLLPLNLARLEKLIQVRLAESFDLDEAPGVHVRIHSTSDDLTGPSIPEDPAYYDDLVDKIVSTLDTYIGEHDPGEPLTVSELNAEVRGAFEEFSPTDACDFLVARLRCMKCGCICNDENSRCETFLRRASEPGLLRVGDAFDFDPAAVRSDYYVRAQPPVDGQPLHVIEGWECPSCRAVNWAEAVVRDGRFESIWSIELTLDALHRAHYVTSETVELAAELSGTPAWRLANQDVFGLLSRYL